MVSAPIPHDPTALASGFLLDGRWRVRPDLNKIFDGEIEYPVPDKFMQVLVVLAASNGVVSRQELFDAVWPETFVVDESLTRAISSLRKLFGDDPKQPRIIETIPKKGYRLLVSAEALDTGNGQCQVEAQGPPPVDAPAASPTMRRWPMLLAAVTLLAITVMWVQVRRHRQPEPEVSRTQLTALPGIEEYPALSPAGDRIAFVWDGDDSEPDGVFVQVVGAGPAIRLTSVDGHYAFPAWTHDSRFIAYARVSGSPLGIFKVPATGGAELEVAVAADEKAVLTSPAYSPDGRWLLYSLHAADGTARLIKVDLESYDAVTFAPSAEIPFGGRRPRVSPDSRSVAFFPADEFHRRIVIATIDGVMETEIDNGELSLTDFDWAADGKHLVISGSGQVRLVGINGSARRVFSSPQNTGALSVAPQAELIAFSTGRRERNIWRWRPANDLVGETLTRIVHSTAWDASPAISPNGARIAFLTNRTGILQLWVADHDGGSARMLAEVSNLRWDPIAWSPDGKSLAVTVDASGVPTTCIVSVANGTYRILEPLEGGETHPSWAADGIALYVTRATAAGGEIWRRSGTSSDSSATPVVISGGAYRSRESASGDRVFFTRARRGREIWSCQSDGSSLERVFALDEGAILTWAVKGNELVVGIRRRVGDAQYHIVSFDILTGRQTELVSVPGKLGFDLDVEPGEGHSIVYGQTEVVDSDIFAMACP